MSNNEKAFGVSFVGGFRRKDVLGYIEQAAGDHKTEIKALSDENLHLKAVIEKMTGERSDLEVKMGETEKISLQEAGKISELDQQSKRQKDRILMLEANVEVQKSRISELESELKETKAKAGETELKNFELMASVQKYETYMTDIDEAKKLVFDIELEARKRAEGIEEEAIKNAEMARNVLGALIGDAQSRFDCVRTDIESTVSHVVSELERIISAFLSINMSFDDMTDKLSKLNVYTERHDAERTEEKSVLTDDLTDDLYEADGGDIPCGGQAPDITVL